MNLIKNAADLFKGKKDVSAKIESVKVLGKDANPIVKNIANALAEVVESHFSSEEKAMTDKIEELRSKLNLSKDRVNVIDYGAGAATDQRTAEEMYNGVPVANVLGNICRNTSKPTLWAQVLFKIIRHSKVKKCLELGTSVGISGSYQASALKLNGEGVLKTMEGSPEVANIAKNNFNSLNLNNVSVIVGRFQDNLDSLLKEGNYDYAFIDGHHDRDATIKYFEQIYPWFTTPGLLVFDDIKWSGGMMQAWDSIIADKRVNVSVDLGPIGICVIDNNATNKKNYKVSI